MADDSYINSPEHQGRNNMTYGKFNKDNNIDNMVVPPFNLPNDKNTYSPDDVSQDRSGMVKGS